MASPLVGLGDCWITARDPGRRSPRRGVAGRSINPPCSVASTDAHVQASSPARPADGVRLAIAMLTGWQASQPKLRQEMVIPLPTGYTCPVIIRCWRIGIHTHLWWANSTAIDWVIAAMRVSVRSGPVGGAGDRATRSLHATRPVPYWPSKSQGLGRRLRSAARCLGA
jgi:hypothetical protein